MEVIMKAEGPVVSPDSSGSVISAITQLALCFIKNNAESSSHCAHKKVNMVFFTYFAVFNKIFVYICFVITNVIGQL